MRGLAESLRLYKTAISPFKQEIGDGLRLRTDQRRVTEVDVSVHVLNYIWDIGHLNYVRTARLEAVLGQPGPRPLSVQCGAHSGMSDFDPGEAPKSDVRGIGLVSSRVCKSGHRVWTLPTCRVDLGDRCCPWYAPHWWRRRL